MLPVVTITITQHRDTCLSISGFFPDINTRLHTQAAQMLSLQAHGGLSSAGGTACPPQEELGLEVQPLAPLHNHRRVLGVVGIMHCPNVADISKAYLQFEQRCK